MIMEFGPLFENHDSQHLKEISFVERILIYAAIFISKIVRLNYQGGGIKILLINLKGLISCKQKFNFMLGRMVILLNT